MKSCRGRTWASGILICNFSTIKSDIAGIANLDEVRPWSKEAGSVFLLGVRENSEPWHGLMIGKRKKEEKQKGTRMG